MTSTDSRPATPAVSLMIVEDHAITRDGLRMMLEAVGFNVVGEAGACGFLVKTLPRETIIQGILDAHRCGICHPYDSEVTASLEPLTEREMDVLEELRRGLTSAEIGRVLDLSEHTIKTHLKNIFAKLHAADRTEAVAAGFQLGYLRVS